MTNPIESGLRETFASRANRIPDHPDPYAAVAGRMARVRRHRRAAVAATAAAVVLAGVGVPAGLHARDRTSVSAERQGLLNWPARGSLAHDQRLLDGVRVRFTGSAARVLFAGETAGRRMVVVVVGDERAAYGLVLTGLAGAPADRLEQEQLFGSRSAGPGDDDPLIWFDPGQKNLLLVLGPPRMSAVKVRPRLSFHPDGSPAAPRVLEYPVDQGVFFSAVPDAVPEQLSVKTRLDSRYSGAMPPSYSLSYRSDLTFWDKVDNAAEAASGGLASAEARGLLYGLGTIGTPPETLTYRFVWGGSLGGRRRALIAMVRGHTTPRFLIVQTTYTAPDGSTEQDRLGRAIRDETPLDEPVGWTTVTGQASHDDSSPATAAVYVPGRAGARVELWDEDDRAATRTTGPDGVAVFETAVPRSRLRTYEYRVLSAGGAVVHRGRLDLGDLYSAVAGPGDW
ncbi:hypothetical protein Skr01_34620 [Sphaerisporangium krabiense]|uniref:Uncharacterized protein n=1 Tax=Sphaerisporangium krabiense TaxID=763782 RepID=A0A7W8Z2W2_9ACTN|nr:hypothetical protein [Sphaerisporangium krabiense]MBB5626457.1 hypothetical protein [Sphaerisporangium krabiense]GII63377.1 hypothetical protein Skr01_34620 [Sphaerisporangium krabiense]